jgi:PAS domain S-box-containing protein
MSQSVALSFENKLDWTRSLSPSLRAVIAVLFAVLVAVRFAPHALDLPLGLYIPIHTAMEVFAVVVACMVFAVGWNADPKVNPARSHLIACAFLAVALLDLGHLMSVQGMPDFVTPSGPEKGIAFWLPGRLADAVALLLAATSAWHGRRQSGRWTLLTASLGFTAMVYVVVLAWPELLPRTFIAGVGLTPFKIQAEYAIVAIHLLTLILLARQLGREQSDFDAAGLFTATAVMAMSEFFFTLYGTPHDVYLVLGHVYKVIAYALVYRVVFVDAVRRPSLELHKAQERERRAIQAALAASEARFEAMADTVPCIIYSRSTDGTIDFVNRRGREYTGLLGGQDEDVARLIHPDDLEAVHGIFRKGRKSGGSYEVELRLRAADGSYRWFAGGLRALEASGGRRWLAALTEIDTLKRQEAALRTSEQALRESDVRKNEFLATLAHELRNPLAPLRNGLEVLRLAGNDLARRQRVQEMMERQLAHIVRLIDDLLDLSRITTGKLKLRVEKVDLSNVLRDAVEATEPLLRAHRHSLEFDPTAPGALVVDGDAARLQQIVTNLLNNAAKFTEAQGRIALRLARDGDAAVITVRDNGIGIAQHDLESIFELFAQARGGRNHASGGLGIGLNLTRRLAGLHGGTIDVNSEGIDKGSEFRVRLPLAPGDDVRPSAFPASSRQPGRLRVLVIDDNVDAAESLRMVLELSAHEVHVRHDGPAAIEAAQTLLPDLVLLDLGMPGMDGFEVSRRIRMQPWGRKLRIVALSGWAQEDDKARSREAGFDAHVAKPLDPGQLEQLLADCASSALAGSPRDGQGSAQVGLTPPKSESRAPG